MKSRWYVATLIIRSRVEDQPAPYTCDEQIRVIRAFNPDEAYEKAIHLGKNGETTYKNADGQDVSWEFVGLEDLEELDTTIRDGAEIRSRLFGHQNPESLVTERKELRIFQVLAQEKPNRVINENIPAEDNDG